MLETWCKASLVYCKEP